MQKTDIVVIGAGPSGIAASLAAAERGADVVLIDENDAVGGHLLWTIVPPPGLEPPLDGLRGIEIADWANKALVSAGVQVKTSTVAWGLFEQGSIGVVSNDDAYRIQASHIIIATGSTDITWPFPGWELPGVFTATAALRLLHLDRVLPGRKVVVIGDGEVADHVASDIVACGAEVVGRPVNAEGLIAGGIQSVEWVEQSGIRTHCDAIVLAFGRQPDAQLACQAQVDLEFSPETESFLPVRTETLESSIPGLYVIGHAAGSVTVAQALAEGRVAGLAATGGDDLKDAVDHLRSLPPPADVLPQLHEFDDSTLVCRCEEVPASTIRAAIAEGSRSINDIKRKTRTGMGMCQGIYCHRTVSRMLAAQTGVGLDTIVPMTARPPARLISMAALADSLE